MVLVIEESDAFHLFKLRIERCKNLFEIISIFGWEIRREIVVDVYCESSNSIRWDEIRSSDPHVSGLLVTERV
jgi:hypothetical protein